MVFRAYLHVLLNIDYRELEGFLRGLTKLVHFAVPDYATICRRVNRVSIEIKKMLIPFEGKEVVISLDSRRGCSKILGIYQKRKRLKKPE